MGALTSTTAERVAPLVRMLASPHDGEALAAARAIGRVLASARADFNDLAAALIERPPVEARPSTPSPRGERRTRAPRARKAWAELIAWLASHRDELSPRDSDFITSMMTWIDCGRPLSVAQRKWIRDVQRKCGGRPA